jgi:hypothetical protein
MRHITRESYARETKIYAAPRSEGYIVLELLNNSTFTRFMVYLMTGPVGPRCFSYVPFNDSTTAKTYYDISKRTLKRVF